MKKTIILGLFSLVLAASTALGVSINTVLVTSNQLDIPYAGTYAAKNLVKLGKYSLTWHQAGKGADIIATLPTNILSGTYTLTLQGSPSVSVAITADTSLTKNFTTAYAFGAQTVNPYSSVSFTSFIGDWTTNGTSFQIPATGVYRIHFEINYVATPNTFPKNIQILDSNNSSTNGLAYFTYGINEVSYRGEITVQCNQGDLLSINNGDLLSSIGGPDNIDALTFGSYANPLPNNVQIPSASLSIIQIQ